jgi:2-phospho-L-lactate guanylyltransferase
MRVLAVLPLRGLADGKSRLRDVLPDRVRRALILALLERAARAVRGVGDITETLAVSPDPDVLRHAAALGLTPLLQTANGLNPALDQATEWARERGFDALLALHADLPLITTADVQTLLGQLGNGTPRGDLIIVADRHELGTTALLMHPPGVTPFHFGDQSFTRHLVAGETHALRTVAHSSPALAFDLDTPADLAALVAWHPLVFIELCRAVGRWLPQIPQAAPTHPPTPHPAGDNIL